MLCVSLCPQPWSMIKWMILTIAPNQDEYHLFFPVMQWSNHIISVGLLKCNQRPSKSLYNIHRDKYLCPIQLRHNNRVTVNNSDKFYLSPYIYIYERIIESQWRLTANALFRVPLEDPSGTFRRDGI